MPCLRAASIASAATSAVDAESAAKMPPVCNQREPFSAPKIDFPVEIAGLYLADGGVAAVGAAGSRAHAEAALGKVEPVAHRAAHAVVWNPVEQRVIDAALQDEVFDQPADGVIGERGGNGGAQAETAAQAAGHVVFAAALPHLKLARGVDAAFAGIEAEHDFAQAQAIPAARRIGNQNRVHS